MVILYQMLAALMQQSPVNALSLRYKLDCLVSSFPSFEAVLRFQTLSYEAPISWRRIFDAKAASIPATTVPEQNENLELVG